MMLDALEPDRKNKGTRTRWGLFFLIAAVALGELIYTLLWRKNAGTSALMFLGLPLLMALALGAAPAAKTTTGTILKGITLFLLVGAPMAGEGYVCILFAAPLFYLVGLIVGWAIDGIRRNEGSGVKSVALLVLVPMCVEGMTPTLSFNRVEMVEAVRVVKGTPAEVEAEVSRSMRVEKVMPAFLRIGFPRPMWAKDEGLTVGDLRRLHFSGAEGDGPGDLVMRVTQSRPGFVRFERVSDESHLRQWMSWETSEVQWRAVDVEHTEVRCKVTFERRVDPAWYFGPWERLAVKEAAEYMITAGASPHGDAR